MGETDSARTSSPDEGRRLRERVAALERINAELAAREQRLSAISDHANQGIIVAQDGVLKFVNPHVSRMLGWDEEELLSRPFLEFIHPDDQDMLSELHVRFLRGECTEGEHFVRIRTRDGERVHTFELRAGPIDWDGRPAVLCVMVDVTDRIIAERSLRDSETLYHSLFDQANDAIFLVRGDTFIDCNKKTLEMFGCTRDQIIGQPPYRFSPPTQADGRDSTEAAIEKISATFDGDPQRFEWLHCRYDGSVFEAEVSLSNIEIAGEQLVFAFVSDISERKWLERIQATMLDIARTAHTSLNLEELFCAIREALASLMDTTNFYVALYDDESDTYRFECFYDEKDDIQLHAPRDGAGSVTDYVRHSGEPLLVSASEFDEFQRKEGVECGGTRSKSWLGVPLTTPRGVIGVVVVQNYESESAYTKRELDLMSFVAENIGTAVERLRDEEDRVALERQVRQAQRLESLGVLAGGIAHDFNNLLTGILGNADLALLDLPRTSSAATALQEIRHISQRASDLCRQMLAYSGRAASAPEPVNLATEVQSMREVLEALIPETSAFVLDTPPSGFVSADRGQLAQVVRALVSNSVEALGGEPGKVRIQTGMIPKRLTSLPVTAGSETLSDDVECPFIEVGDTGCGMDEETRQRVFEPFFSTKFTGRGLGLPAVQGIVRMHGGEIDIRSEPGSGTTVRIVLPPSGSDAVACAGVGDAQHDGEPVRQKVLLIDDEDIVRRVGETLLDKAGYCVTTAADGHSALEFFREHADDVACVILDLTMPDMDGEQVFQEIRNLREDVPIVIASGYSGNAVSERFEHCEGWAFLQKPFSSDTLISEVARMAGGGESRH